MGCFNGRKSKYNDCEYDEEIEIRNFEIESGAFRKNLYSIIPRICFEKDLISIGNIDDFIIGDFSEQFLKLIKNEHYFKEHEGKKYYDAKRIKLLLLLLTNTSIVNNGKIKYNDKASFIITHIKSNEEDDLNFPILRNDANLINFLYDIFDISAIFLVDSFVHIKDFKKQESLLLKIKNYKEKTCESILENLYYDWSTKKPLDGLTFKEINKKLENDKFIFTSGWIREFAFQVMAAENSKKREEDKS
jgi:hypothetical protein